MNSSPTITQSVSNFRDVQIFPRSLLQENLLTGKNSQSIYISKQAQIFSQKLAKLEVPLHLIATIRSFLTNRKFSVRQTGWISASRIIKAGVPQGSYLSPLSFIVYINDMPTSTCTNINLFADNTMIYATSIGTKPPQTRFKFTPIFSSLGLGTGS